jgi:CHASE2 domain-containing sensor protein
VPLADLFMRAMLSRPASGSLRVTWVTPATLSLAVVIGLGAVALLVICAAALARGGGWPLVVGMAGCAVIGAGSSAVGLVGAAQRRRG